MLSYSEKESFVCMEACKSFKSLATMVEDSCVSFYIIGLRQSCSPVIVVGSRFVTVANNVLLMMFTLATYTRMSINARVARASTCLLLARGACSYL